MIPIPQVVPAPPEHPKTKTTCRPDKTPWWKTLGEGIALLGGIGLLIVNIYQMRATENAANTAVNSFNLEKRRAEDLEEAICAPNANISFGNTVYQFDIPNSGHVAARNVHGHFVVALNNLPSNQRQKLLAEFDVAEDVLARERGVTKYFPLDLSKEDWKQLGHAKQTIVVTGELRYDNGFDRERTTPVCYALVWYSAPRDTQNPFHGNGVTCNYIPRWLQDVPQPQ